MPQISLSYTAEPDHLKYYDVTPLTIPADSRRTIAIKPLFEHAAFTGEVKVNVYSFDGRRADGSYGRGPIPNVENTLAADGTLEVTADFTGEQQHDIEVSYVRPKTMILPERPIKLRFCVYSLKADLLGLLPLKGDFHCHSSLTDGQESPEYVAARYREAGFDFFALSDHHIYTPSLRAIERCGTLFDDYKIFPAEEVHLPGNRVHVLNFGGRYSVNELARKDPAAFEAGWKAIAATMPEPPNNRSGEDDGRRNAAISEWAFDEIRKAGGVSMFCHFAWQTQGLDVDGWTTDTLIARRKFDLFELIGGYSNRGNGWKSNNIQVARYYAEMAKGNKMPVAGVSDSHSTDGGTCYNWYYTIALAKDDSFEAIADALRSGLSVAVEAVQPGLPRAYGEERLVAYTLFLLENYFPRTQRLCRTEGALFKEAIAGDAAAAAQLKTMQGRVPALRNRCFPR